MKMTDILQKQGTYVCVYYTKETKKNLREWFKTSGLDRGRVRVESIHTTLLFSRRTVLRAYDQVGPRTIVAKSLRFDIFDSETGTQDVLVLVLDCPIFHEMHKDFLAMGGTNDRPYYNPHVTLTFNIPEGFDVKSLKLPDFDFVTTEVFAEPLNLDWAEQNG